MKHILFFLAISQLLFSCDYMTAERIRGNGNVITQDRKVSDFKGCESYGSFEVHISPGAPSVRVEAEENLQPYIEITNNGNNLRITTKSGYSINEGRPIKVYVTNNEFRTVSARFR